MLKKQPRTELQVSGTAKTALEAFDQCPNRAIDTENGAYVLRCAPKYPEGTPIGHSRIDHPQTRESIGLRLGCLGCSYSKVEYGANTRSQQMELLHPDITTASASLYETEHHPQAVMASIGAVREKLRGLTGFEKASEAFGKGKIIIEAGVPEHTEPDLQQAAKLLLMGLDMLRNVGAHGNYGNLDGPEVAFEVMATTSLTMRILDRAVVPVQDGADHPPAV